MCLPSCNGHIFSVFGGVFLLVLPLFLVFFSWRKCHVLRGLYFPYRRRCILEQYVLERDFPAPYLAVWCWFSAVKLEYLDGGKFLRDVESLYVTHESRRFWDSVSGGFHFPCSGQLFELSATRPAS